jgi:putative restriction endonuclease
VIDMRADVLDRVQTLNVWKRGGERAPHKPLLLLYALAQASHGERDIPYVQVDEVLRGLLMEFGPSRKQYHPELPFWHLQSDGLWEVLDAETLPRRKGRNKCPLRSVLL